MYALIPNFILKGLLTDVTHRYHNLKFDRSIVRYSMATMATQQISGYNASRCSAMQVLRAAVLQVIVKYVFINHSIVVAQQKSQRTSFQIFILMIVAVVSQAEFAGCDLKTNQFFKRFSNLLGPSHVTHGKCSHKCLLLRVPSRVSALLYCERG